MPDNFLKAMRKPPISKVDDILIRQYSIILLAISCGYQLNIQKFREYALDAAKCFINFYDWCKMPTSVHQLLIHGADVRDIILLPIRPVNEEILEVSAKESGEN